MKFLVQSSAAFVQQLVLFAGGVVAELPDGAVVGEVKGYSTV